MLNSFHPLPGTYLLNMTTAKQTRHTAYAWYMYCLLIVVARSDHVAFLSQSKFNVWGNLFNEMFKNVLKNVSGLNVGCV